MCSSMSVTITIQKKHTVYNKKNHQDNILPVSSSCSLVTASIYCKANRHVAGKPFILKGKFKDSIIINKRQKKSLIINNKKWWRVTNHNLKHYTFRS